MKFGVLADSFEGAGAKYLTEVEVDFLKSNQHEFQGVNSFWRFLGRASQKIRYPATYYWLDDEEGSEPIRVEAFGTWGDVRKNTPNGQNTGSIIALRLTGWCTKPAQGIFWSLLRPKRELYSSSYVRQSPL